MVLGEEVLIVDVSNGTGVVASMKESCNLTGVRGFKYTEVVVVGGVVVSRVSDRRCSWVV